MMRIEDISHHPYMSQPATKVHSQWRCEAFVAWHL